MKMMTKVTSIGGSKEETTPGETPEGPTTPGPEEPGKKADAAAP